MILFAQCILSGYLLFYINRASSPLRASKGKENQGIQIPYIAHVGFAAFLVVAALSTIYHFLLHPGLMGSHSAATLMPQRIIDWEYQIYANHWTVGIYVGAVLMVLLTNVCLSLQKQVQHKRLQHGMMAMSIGAGMASVVQIIWGYTLGLPSHEHSGGGTFNLLNGILLMLFAILCWRSLSQSVSLMHERRMFLIGIVLTPTMIYWTVEVISFIKIVPQIYINQGHGYEFACIAAILIPMVLAMIAAIYNSETRRYAVN